MLQVIEPSQQIQEIMFELHASTCHRCLYQIFFVCWHRYCWSKEALLLLLNACKIIKFLLWSFSWGMQWVLQVFWLRCIIGLFHSIVRMNGMLFVTTSRFIGFRPKLQHVQNQVQQYVKNMMSEQLRMPSTALRAYGKTNNDHRLTKPAFIASCSGFGPKVLLSTPSPIR